MRLFPLLLLIIQWCDARVASSETGIVPNVNINVKERELLNYPCVFRTLQSYDPYPSVVVKWQNQVQRLTWTVDGIAKLHRNYKQPKLTFTYPSSGGLSGDGGAPTTTPEPFAEAPVVPDNYDVTDIIDWFSRVCVKPY